MGLPVLNHPWIDESRAPLYIADLRDCTEEEAERFYATCGLLYVHPDCDVAWVLDASRVSRVSARQRRISADHIKRFAHVMRVHVAGVALVIPSLVVRGALTAISWLAPLPFPYEIAKDREEAIAWATERLQARQVGARNPASDSRRPPADRC